MLSYFYMNHLEEKMLNEAYIYINVYDCQGYFTRMRCHFSLTLL